MKFKLLFLLNLFSILNFAKVESDFLSPAMVTALRESFKPLLEVPPKFLKFRALWYEGNNRQQMSNILMKERVKKRDLYRLIYLLNREEKRLNYKASVIADAVNAVIKKKFIKELLHLMPLERIEKEARATFLNPSDLVLKEKLRHKKLIEELTEDIRLMPVPKHVASTQDQMIKT